MIAIKLADGSFHNLFNEDEEKNAHISLVPAQSEQARILIPFFRSFNDAGVLEEETRGESQYQYLGKFELVEFKALSREEGVRVHLNIEVVHNSSLKITAQKADGFVSTVYIPLQEKKVPDAIPSVEEAAEDANFLDDASTSDASTSDASTSDARTNEAENVEEVDTIDDSIDFLESNENLNDEASVGTDPQSAEEPKTESIEDTHAKHAEDKNAEIAEDSAAAEKKPSGLVIAVVILGLLALLYALLEILGFNVLEFIQGLLASLQQ